MKILENPQYEVLPTGNQISAYPTMLDILEELSEDEEKKIETFDPLRRTIIAPLVRNGFYLVANSNDEPGFVELMPTGRNKTVLYRGQSCYYGECKPSLYRNYNEYKQLLSNLQMSEMKVLLDSHPILNYISKNSLHHPMIAEPIRLQIHYRGLAQHYGIHTDLFDFTVDKWTAAFFATTRYVDGDYLPIVEKDFMDRFGVFYIYDNCKKTSVEAKPIGMHYFNRPGVQGAYALKMCKGQNLNEQAGIRKLFFRHDAESSSVVYTMHQGGKALFPKDSLADKVKCIVENKTFSLAALVECNASYYHLPDDEFQALLDKYAIQVQPTPVVAFQAEVLKKEWEDWQNGGKERYINSLIVIPVVKLDTKKDEK